MSSLLKEKGVSTGFLSRDTIGLPNNDELIKSFRTQANDHNEAIIRNLIAHHHKNAQKELERLMRLAKEFGVKIEMDTNDWNKLALKIAQEERDGHRAIPKQIE